MRSHNNPSARAPSPTARACSSPLPSLEMRAIPVPLRRRRDLRHGRMLPVLFALAVVVGLAGTVAPSVRAESTAPLLTSSQRVAETALPPGKLANTLAVNGAARQQVGTFGRGVAGTSPCQANQVAVGVSGSGLPPLVGPYSYCSPAALNPTTANPGQSSASGSAPSQPQAPVSASATGVWSHVPQTNPPVRYNASMTYDTARQQVVMFGGCCAAASWELGDTWTRDAQGWRQLIPPSSPPGREAAAMAYDAATDRVVLFGGVDFRNSHVFGDTWMWDGQTWTEMHPASSPSPRFFASMTYDAQRREIVLFGGPDNQTWIWDGVTWTERQPQTVPPRRIAATLAYDEARQNAVLFGGQGCQTVPIPVRPIGQCGGLNDTWTWDGTTWTQHLVLLPPPARVQAVMDYDVQLQATVLFGGSSNDAQNVWLWDGGTWKSQAYNQGPSSSTGYRQASAMVYEQRTHQMLLFGGLADDFMDDTWTWDEAGWTEIARTWPGRPYQEYKAAFDAARNQLVLLELERGCGYGTTCATATWTWDGSIWTKRNPPSEPPPRRHAGIAYDAARKQVVLFGGTWGKTCPPPPIITPCQLTSLNDTWTWDGTTWTQHNTPFAPSPRQYAAMAYDARDKEVILFGGADCHSTNGRCANSDETWAWNGQTWEQRNPAASPSARRGANFAYDASSSELVLFGGETNACSPYQDCPLDLLLDDTWTWDGSNWKQQQPAQSPSPRTWSAMGYSAATSQLVLFGGEPCPTASNPYAECNDTWAWSGGSWQQLMPGSATSAPSYSGRPSQRSLPAVAEGPDGNLVVFGGQGFGQNDMWTWGSSSPGVAVPEAPFVPLLPLVMIGVGVGLVTVRRRRRATG